MKKIKIKKLDSTAVIPTRGSEYAAGYDLYANVVHPFEDNCVVTMQPGETTKIKTGIALEISDGYFGAIFARSGLATKQGLRPANCVGVIDSDYRGEIIVAIHNDSDTAQTIHNGDRIAQIVILPYLGIEFEETTELSDTDRGIGGFGSTDGTWACIPGVTYEQLTFNDYLDEDNI